MSDLIDRQAVLDALSNAVPSLTTPDGCGQFDRELQIVGEALVDAMQIVQALPTSSPWHSMEEPPKEYGNYIAVVNGEVMEVTYSDMSIRDDWKWSTCDAEGFAWIRSESVTHWMPLPEPPEWIEDVDNPPEFDPCYECSGYGDDYHIDEDGELVWNCPDCPFNEKEEE